MPIEVGDAVLRFLGDSTQLDLAFDAVGPKAQVAMAEASTAFTGFDEVMGETSVSIKEAYEGFGVFGVEGVAAAQEVAFNMREAKGEIMLLGNEIGVSIPRHLQRFIADLPGVGQALTAVFSATAVLFLVQILEQGIQKLSDWAASTLIFTQTMKDSDAEIADQNKELSKLKDEYEKTQEKVEAFGKTQVELATEKLNKLTEEIAKQDEILKRSVDTYKAHQEATDWWGRTVDFAIESARAMGVELGNLQTSQEKSVEQNRIDYEKAKTIAAAQKKADEVARDLAEKDRLKAIEEAYVARQSAVIEGEQKIGSAQIKLEESQALVTVANLKNNLADIIAIRSQAAEDEYQLQVGTIEKRIVLEQRDPTKNANSLRKLNAELEAIEIEHATKATMAYADLLEKLKVIRHNAMEALTTADVKADFTTQLTKDFEKAAAAASALGFTFSGDLAKGVADAKKAYDDLRASGQATNRDLLAGQIALLQSQINYDKSFSISTTAQEKELSKLVATYNKLYGASDKVFKKHQSLFQLWKTGAPQAGEAWTNMLSMATQGLDSLANASEHAFASAIMGQESFGKALEKATAQTLANLAAQAMVYAIFYTAMGFAKLAEYDFTGASNAFTSAAIYAAVGGMAAGAAYALNSASGGSGSGGSGSHPNVGSVSSSATVSQVGGSGASQTNTQFINSAFGIKLGEGGLITKPTMAVIGESTKGAEEAAIPLHDPQAVSKIVEALGGTRDSGVKVYVQGMISPDNLGKVVEQINKKVKGRQLTLNSSNTYRVTRRSQ